MNSNDDGKDNPNMDMASFIARLAKQNDSVQAAFRNDDINWAIGAIRNTLYPEQIAWFDACLALLNPEIRGRGKTYAMMAAAVVAAITHPAKPIALIDHHLGIGNINQYFLAKECEKIIALLPPYIRAHTKIIRKDHVMAVVYSHDEYLLPSE